MIVSTPEGALPATSDTMNLQLSSTTTLGRNSLLEIRYARIKRCLIKISTCISMLVLLAILVMPSATYAEITVHYFHSDHLGTPRQITNQGADIVWSSKAFPFGKRSGISHSIEWRTDFIGQRYDAESGLHYNFRRYYDSGIGRYLQTDPIGLRGGGNVYEYALSNPVKYADPRGECGVLGAIAGGVVGGIGGLYIGLISAAYTSNQTPVPNVMSKVAGLSMNMAVVGAMYGSCLPAAWQLAGGIALLAADAAIYSAKSQAAPDSGSLASPPSVLSPPSFGTPRVEDNVYREFCRQNPQAPNCEEEWRCE